MKPHFTFRDTSLTVRILHIIIKGLGRVALTLHHLAARLHATTDRLEHRLLAHALDRHTACDEILAGFAEAYNVTFDPDASTFDKLTLLRRAHAEEKTQLMNAEEVLTGEQMQRIREIVDALREAAEQSRARTARRTHPEDTQ